MENFFIVLKREIFYGYEVQYKNTDELIQAIHQYIQYYNNDRIKVKLKGLSLVQYSCLVNKVSNFWELTSFLPFFSKSLKFFIIPFQKKLDNFRIILDCKFPCKNGIVFFIVLFNVIDSNHCWIKVDPLVTT